MTREASFTPTIRPVLVGVDTLHLHTTSPLRAPIYGLLERARAAAEATPRDEPLPRWEAAGIPFEMRRSGSMRGTYLLEHPSMAISINPNPMKGIHTVYAELRAEHLWATGYADAADVAQEVFAQLAEVDEPDEESGEVRQAQVSRVDLTCDFQGWVPVESDLHRFSCRARKDASHRESKELTGWSWGGGGAVLARLYDKRREMKGTDKAEWFPKLWAGSTDYVEADATWRLEYQVKREALREFVADADQLRGWDRLKENLGSLWQQLASSWLVMRGQRIATSRRTIHPLWNQLVRAPRWANSTVGVDVQRVKLESEFNRTLDQLSAYLARGVAERWALDGQQKHWRLTVDELIREAENRANKKSKPLPARARDLFEPLKAAAELKAERSAKRAQLRDDERERMSAAAHQPYRRQPGEEG